MVAQRRPGPRPRRHGGFVGGCGKVSIRSTKAGAETPATPPAGNAALECPETRSTKAGAETPATLHGLVVVPFHHPRSTKAGAETPATLAMPRGNGRVQPAGALNEGRGRDPGDTGTRRARRKAWTSTLNEGRGRDPGDTTLDVLERPVVHPRSTKAGAETPATRHRPLPSRHETIALNEGRGRDPGDTCGAFGLRHTLFPPLNEGRGRDPGDTGAAPARSMYRRRRSTKAGAETPATPASDVTMYSSDEPAQRRPGPRPRRHRSLVNQTSARFSDAQRRPGPRPRRHWQSPSPHLTNCTRSTKAGAETPATHLWSTLHSMRNDRSTKAGAETPATRRRPARPRRSPGTLNEGRGRDPGDTGNFGRGRRRLQDRSTKAGAETPATLAASAGRSGRSLRALNEGRGRDPGDTANRRGTPSWMQFGNRSADA